MSIYVKNGGVWKPARPSIKDGGVWKTVQKAFVKNAGVWKQFFSNFGNKVTCNFTGSAQTFTVPAGVTALRIKAWGAGGGGPFLSGQGGAGGFVRADVVVTPGPVITINVGQGGIYADQSTTPWADGSPAAWVGAGGGGASSSATGSGFYIGGGGGGGASDGNTGAGNQPGGPGGTTLAPAAYGGAPGGRFQAGGAGGANSITGGTFATSIAGTGANPDSSDPDFPNAGFGGTATLNGANGAVIIAY